MPENVLARLQPARNPDPLGNQNGEFFGKLSPQLLFSDTPRRLGKIRFWDASETDTINRTMYQIRGTTRTVT
jgi:hypothetical protein